MVKHKWLITCILIASVLMQGLALARVFPPTEIEHNHHLQMMGMEHADHTQAAQSDSHAHTGQPNDTLKCHGTSYCCVGLGFISQVAVDVNRHLTVPPVAYIATPYLSADQDLLDKPPRS